MLGGIAGFVAKWSGAGAVFAVTSYGQQMLTGGQIARTTAADAAAAIASIGGTLDGFNSAITTSGSGYALIGWAGAGAGSGVETSGANARLRGALAPDAASLMKPANVSADGPPAEKLQQLLVQAPSTGWRYDADPARKRRDRLDRHHTRARRRPAAGLLAAAGDDAERGLQGDVDGLKTRPARAPGCRSARAPSPTRSGSCTRS